jgi:hypothetical protein
MSRESSKEMVAIAQDLINVTQKEIDEMSPEQRAEHERKVRSLAGSVLSQANNQD